MTKILLVGVGIVGVALMAIVPGNAADLWVPPVYTVPVRLFSWTGCYVGGNIGWGWGRETVSLPDLGETTGVPALAGVSLGPVTGDTRGVLGGGQVGCNYQFAPNWVIGFEGDGEAAKIKGDVSETVSPCSRNGHRNGQCPDRLDCQRHWSPRLDVGSRDALCQRWRGMGRSSNGSTARHTRGYDIFARRITRTARCIQVSRSSNEWRASGVRIHQSSGWKSLSQFWPRGPTI
jgi:opacity protein-like surface antigen